MNSVPFEQLYRQMLLSQNEIAKRADVDSSIVKKARRGDAIGELSALKLLAVVNKTLQTSYALEDIVFVIKYQGKKKNT